jgi:hypothetical protein
MFSRSHHKSHGHPKEQKKRSADAQVELLRDLGLVNADTSSSRSGVSGWRKDSDRPAHSSGVVRSFTGAIFPEKSEFYLSNRRVLFAPDLCDW